MFGRGLNPVNHFYANKLDNSQRSSTIGTPNIPLTTAAMLPYHISQPDFTGVGNVWNLFSYPSHHLFLSQKFSESGYGQTSQSGRFPSPIAGHKDEPPRKNPRLSFDACCPICDKLTVSAQELNEHFIEEATHIEKSFQAFKAKLLSENLQSRYLELNRSIACENRYKILEDAKLRISDRRQNKMSQSSKQYSLSRSLKSKTEEEDIDVDFGANEGNDGASSASSPQAADFECIEKKPAMSPFQDTVHDCHLCGKTSLDAFVRPAKCRHFLCLDCFDIAFQKDKRCTVCKSDLSEDDELESKQETSNC